MWLLGGVPPMWEAEMSQAERDTQTIVLGGDDDAIRAAETRRDARINAFSSASQPMRLDEASLAQAFGLVQGLMAGRGVLSDGDFAHALAQFYQVCSDPHGANALAGTVVEMSQFIARRAKQGS